MKWKKIIVNILYWLFITITIFVFALFLYITRPLTAYIVLGLICFGGFCFLIAWIENNR